MTDSKQYKFDIFISYSRKDNTPRNPGDAYGWVTALREEILADHRRFSTDPLRVFFDTSEIQDMDDWRHRILTGLRESKILLVCLSPDYFASEYCCWEFDEYVQRQVHKLMGFDSFAQVYFVEVPSAPVQDLKKSWHKLLLRNIYTDLRPWFPLGVKALCDASVRQKLYALGTSLWERLQRARRATSVPGNLRRLNSHFIGRQSELRQLHENLALGAVGVVVALHGLGGQGKTELATAYAHGWADNYAAGLWVLGAEGKKELLPLLGELCPDLGISRTNGINESAEACGRRVLAELKRRAVEVALRDPDKSNACLVILDNVSDSLLLSEPQLANLPREDWLRVLATTREGPQKFPAARGKSIAFIAVDALSEDDATRLLADHQIETNGQWPPTTADADTAAAREIARELGGFTLAMESVAVHLGLHPEIRPADFLSHLRTEGTAEVDVLSGDTEVAGQMFHREKMLGLVLSQTLDRMSPVERTALEYAALFPPECVPWPWLRKLSAGEHPDLGQVTPGCADAWFAVRRRLEGLRLITSRAEPEIGRMHRLVSAHLRKLMKDMPMGQSAPATSHKLSRRMKSVSELVSDEIHAKPIFWKETWIELVFKSLLDEPEMRGQLDQAKLKHAYSCILLAGLHWASKSKNYKKYEPAVKSFNMAIEFQKSQCYEKSTECFTDAATIFQDGGLSSEANLAVVYLIVLKIECGADSDTSTFYEASSNITDIHSCVCAIGWMGARFSHLSADSKWREALLMIQAIERAARRLEWPLTLADSLVNQGSILANHFSRFRLALAKFAEAQHYCLQIPDWLTEHQKNLSVESEVGIRKSLAKLTALTQLNMGIVLEKLGEAWRAKTCFFEAIPLLKEIGDSDSLKKAESGYRRTRKSPMTSTHPLPASAHSPSRRCPCRGSKI